MSADNKKFEYQAFTKPVIDDQFAKLKETINPLWSHKKIMEEVHKILVNRMMLASIYDKDSPELTLYRVTPIYKGFDATKKSCYSYPPNPGLGRANIPGMPVLYTSLDPVSAIAEMKGLIKEEEWFYVSEWRIRFLNELNMHTLVLNTETQNEEHILSPLTQKLNVELRGMVKSIPEQFQEGFVYAIQKMGELFTTPNDSMYHITSAYSHEILYGLREIKALMPVIIYPAVENEQSSINFAMHPSLADSELMSLENVFKVCITENKIKDENGYVKINISRKGVFEQGKFIRWEAPFFEIIRSDYSLVQMLTYNECQYKGMKANNKIINHSKLAIKDWIKTLISSDEFQEILAKQPVYDVVESPLSSDSIVYNYVVIIELNHGVEIDTIKGRSCVRRLSIPITWKKEYREVTE